MMNKKFLLVSSLCLLLCSCAQSPYSNKQTTSASDEAYCSPENCYDNIDLAYEASYTKFTLPERSAIKYTKPKGVYNLELEYVTPTKSKEWFEEKLPQLCETFGFTDSGSFESDWDFYKISYGDDYVALDEYVYSIWNDNEFDLNLFDSSELICVNRLDKIDDNVKAYCDKIQNYADQIKDIVGDDLDTTVYDVVALNSGSTCNYKIYMQKSYDGVGIMNTTETSEGFSGDANEKQLISYLVFDSYVFVTGSGEPYIYFDAPIFKAAKAEPIDKILSFKGACDILEQELASNIDYEFDDVELLYEPYGYVQSGGEHDYDNVECTPKWYFIIDDEANSIGCHQVYTITVDCVTGEVEVNI